jgi:3-phenylpropionate/cinnamic acid dioxygenase small subunit
MSDTDSMASPVSGANTEARRAVADFLFREARLLDDHDYDEWLDLWDGAGIYLVPANGDDPDPDRQVSLIYDNRGRLGRRVAQMQTGYRHAQLPQSRTQHWVSNIEIVEESAERIEVRSAYLIIEARFGNVRIWPGRARHELARDPDDGELRMLKKTVVFIDNDLPVTTLGFLP